MVDPGPLGFASQGDFHGDGIVPHTTIGQAHARESQLMPYRILVVDDETAIREAIRMTLEYEGDRVDELRERAERDYQLVGDAPGMLELRAQIERAAPTKATVLIQGESGTGKELVAREIHRRSSRAQMPFIQVNCAAIPEELIESELFGHEKGSFTGAVRKQTGKFVAADGGTIFLDEIGDMSLRTQAKV